MFSVDIISMGCAGDFQVKKKIAIKLKSCCCCNCGIRDYLSGTKLTVESFTADYLA